jgi:hypothetical protein
MQVQQTMEHHIIQQDLAVELVEHQQMVLEIDQLMVV